MTVWKDYVFLWTFYTFFISTVLSASSKNGTYSWSFFQYGTTGMDVAETIIADDSNGNFYFTGFVSADWLQPTKGLSDAVIVKSDPSGNILNYLMMGSQYSDKANHMVMKKENDESFTMYVAGQTSGSLFSNATSTKGDGFIAAVKESDMTYLWTNQLVNSNYSAIFKISLDPSNDNNLYAVGATDEKWASYGINIVDRSRDVWILKMDRHTGSVIWMKSFGTSNDDQGEGVTVDSEGYLYGVASTQGDVDSLGLESLGGTDAVLFKMDSQGNFVWTRMITTSGFDDLYSIALSLDESVLYAVGGTTANISRNGTEIPTVGTSGYDYSTVFATISTSNGEVMDVHVVYSTGGAATFTDVTVGADSRVYVCGSLNGADFAGVVRGTVSSDFDAVLAIYATSDSLDYVEILGTSWDDDPGSIFLQSDSTVWLGGYTTGTLGQQYYGSADIAVMKATPKSDESSSKNSNQAVIIIAVVCAMVPFVGLSIFGCFIFRRIRRRRIVNQAFGSEQSSQNSSSLYQQPRSSGTNYAALHAIRISEYEEFGSKGSTSNVSTGSQPSQEGSSDKLTQMLSLRNDWMINYDELLLEKKIGAGAFGEVFRGSWRGIPVAVKRMIQTDAETEKIAIEDFLTEASLMKKLRPHPNITLLLGICSSPLCIVTEFVSNGSLLTWLQSNKPIDNDTKISIIRGIAAGMLHLHREGVIHRDLAARNILITSSWKPKVSDFGLSRVTLDNQTNKTEASIGPIKWMAPEALLDKVYNTRTDIWSFGIVIYEVLVRKTPYYDHDGLQVGTKVALGKLNLTEEIQKEEGVGAYPGVLLTLMKKCLQYAPNDRPEFQEVIAFMDEKNNPNGEFVQ